MDTYQINIKPVPYLRMTQADRAWKNKLRSKKPNVRKRAERVRKYMEYKEAIRWAIKLNRIPLGGMIVLSFNIQMPKSKKKYHVEGGPHMIKPDVDNLLKAFMDAAKKEDSDIHIIFARKTWSKKPAVKVVVPTPDEIASIEGLIDSFKINKTLCL